MTQDPAGYVRASFAQQRLWLLDRVQGGSREYHVTERVDIAGPLDRGALEQAVNALVRRHDILRTTFGDVDGDPVQIVHAGQPMTLEFEDLRGAPSPAARIAAAVAEEWERPLDLARGPLMRVRLLQTSTDAHVLLRTCHHIVTDGTSQAVFNRELGSIYNALVEGRPPELPPVPVQYADYARTEIDRLDETRLAEGTAHWASRLRGVSTRPGLPADRARGARRILGAGVHAHVIPDAVASALRDAGREHKATVMTMMLAAFAALLCRHTTRRDLLIGMPVTIRPDERLDDTMGFFVNMLPLRLRVDPAHPFGDLVRSVKETLLDAYRYQDVPFERIVEALRPASGAARTPFFEVVFGQNRPSVAPALAGLRTSVHRDDSRPPRFDLEMHVEARGPQLECSWIYDRALFESWRIVQLATHLVRLIERATDEPTRAIGDLRLLSADERRRLLEGWMPGAPPIPHGDAAVSGQP